jgi:hypothetical protein
VDWVLKITDKTKVQPAPEAAVIQVANELGPVSGDVRIVSQVVDAAGNPSNELEIGGAGLTELSPPRLAAEPAGNSFVVWAGDGEDNATVRGRVLDGQGNPVTPEIIIASGDAAAPGHPSVATLANGDFLVTWSGWDTDGSGPFIRYQTFDRRGSPLTPPTVAMDCEPVAGDFPQATSLSWGGFAIAWEMSGGAGIHVLQLDSLGNPSEMDLAQGTEVFPVLETIVDQGYAPGVSYGLYSPDGSSVGGDSLTVVTSPGICR